MFSLHYHEHSPRVTLLQILLKDEFPLRVDGIFGPKTLTAVREFQRAHRIFPSGLPTPETWEQLLRGTRLAVISSIDADDSVMATQDAAALRDAGDEPILLSAMCNGVGQLVTEVGTRAAGKSIAALRLDGHGNLGRWMTVSVGEVVDLAQRDPRAYHAIAGEYFSYIDNAHFAKIAPLLSRLSSQFAPFGFAEHHGCSLGKQPKTREMMVKLANLWGVPISVGYDKQPYGVITYFKGLVFTAYPRHLNLRTWSNQFQDVSVRNMCAA